MTNYKRLISYMYEYENGIKRKNVGYVRIEVKNGQCKFTIHMQLPGQPDSIFPTYMLHRDSSGLDLIYLGDSLLKAHIMDSRFVADEANIMDSGYSLKQMSGILIFMNDNIFFATLWDDCVLRAEELLQAMKADNKTQKANKKKNDGEIADRQQTEIKAGPDSKESYADNKLYSDMETANDYNREKSDAERDEEGSKKEKVSKEILSESSQNPKKAYEELQKTDGTDEKKPECENIEKENKEEGYYEEKLSLEEELKIPTYKFPRGLKTVEMFRRSKEMADKIYNADKDDKANEITGEGRQMETGMKTANKNITEVSGPDTGDKEPGLRAEKELKAAGTGPAEAVGSNSAVLDNIMARFNRLYPFEDNEIVMCVKIEPKDIGLLPKEYWPLSSNSFLLHGYYCYHHLILAKMRYKDRDIYILGVPGLFQHREQFMARMFGFDCFKSIKKREPKKGDFGYWYIQLNC